MISKSTLAKQRQFDFVQKKFREKNYTLLTTEYENMHQKMDYICPEGHVGSMRADHFTAGHRCRVCANKKNTNKHRHSIDFICSEFEKEGYQLLTTEYENAFQKLNYICPNGHCHSVAWNDFQQGYRCPYCYGKIKKTIEEIKPFFEEENYQLLTTEYKNSKQKLQCVCHNGHDYFVSWDSWKSGSRCPRCNNNGTSKQEQEILEFIKTIYSGTVVERDKILISPYELDIIIPDKKLAIEYCGLYWHSELFGKDKNYHVNKLDMCNRIGYRLITIFSDEFEMRRDIVLSRITNLLGCDGGKIIHARKCNIALIDGSEAKRFCDQNHLQGYGSGSKIKLGAFYDTELVSIMTFSRPSLAKGHRNVTGNIYELHRFCSKIGYRVLGIASKLMKYFDRNYDYDRIYTYADRRWSEGNLYEKIGFKFVGITQQNYWYIDDHKRRNRFTLRKRPDEPKDVTEWTLRQAEGWDRIWDCGNFKYEKIKEI